LERRIDGAKLIDHVCKQAMIGSMSSTISSGIDLKQQLVNALQEKDVVNEFLAKHVVTPS